MILTLKRIPMRAGKPYQVGRLYIDGTYFCDTIEDQDRGLRQSMPLSEIKRVKVKHQTAIPLGTYRVLLNQVSPKFSRKRYYNDFCQGKVPRLQNVPGFEGILIHCGFDHNSTSGCIIVGFNTVVGRVTSSQLCFERLYKRLLTATEPIYIEINRTDSTGL